MNIKGSSLNVGWMRGVLIYDNSSLYYHRFTHSIIFTLVTLNSINYVHDMELATM